MASQFESDRLHQEALLRQHDRKLMVRVRRKILPCIIIVVLSVIFSAPYGLPGQGELQTALILGTVWFWSLYRPVSMPLLGLFFSGLVIELFSTSPLGIALLWILIVYGVAHGLRFRLAQGGFWRSWGCLGSVVFGEALLTWFLMSIRAHDALSFYPVFFQEALAVGVYPFLHVLYLWLLHCMERYDNL